MDVYMYTMEINIKLMKLTKINNLLMLLVYILCSSYSM